MRNTAEYELPRPSLYDATEDVEGYTAEQMHQAYAAGVAAERDWFAIDQTQLAAAMRQGETK